MAEDNQLTFTVVFNKDTGQLVGAAQDVKKLEEATASAAATGTKANAQTTASAKAAASATTDLGHKATAAGKAGDDGMKKIQSRVAEVASGVLIAQLALEGFKTVAKDSEAFQGLQSTFMEISETAVNDLSPSLDLISKGLQGLALMAGGVAGILQPMFSSVIAVFKSSLDILTGMVGAAINLATGNIRGAKASLDAVTGDIKAEFVGLGDQWTAGFKKLEDGFTAGLDRINGKTKAFTKQRAEDLNAALNAEIAHNDAMLQIKESFIAAEANKMGVSNEHKLALLKYQEDLELNNLKVNEGLKAQALKNSRDAHQITEKQFQTQMQTLEKQSADTRLSIQAKASLQRKAIAESEKQAMKAVFAETEQAFVSAVVGQIKAGEDLQTAMRAGAGAIIQTASEQASKVIVIKGAEAAATAFAAAGNPVAGAVAAAGVMAWYTGLAVLVGGAGAMLSNAVTGDNSTSSKSTAASSSGMMAATASETPAAVAAAPQSTSGGAAYTPSAGSGGGQLVVNVLLDSAPILRLVQQASFNGNLEISARAISGG